MDPFFAVCCVVFRDWKRGVNFFGNVDAAFARGRWIVAAGTHAGCGSAKLPNQANIPKPLGYVNPTSLWLPGLFHSQNLFDLLDHLRRLNHYALGHGLKLIA